MKEKSEYHTGFNPYQLSPIIKQKMQGLSNLLNQENIDIKALRGYLADGIPDEVSALKQIAWKIILGYLPKNRSKWHQQQQKQHKFYHDFVTHYLPEQKFIDYPIVMYKGHQKWNQYQKDYHLWQQIEKDTCRTQSQLSFFSEQAPNIMIPFLTAARKQKWKLINGQIQNCSTVWKSNKEQQRKTYKYDYLTRILFIFAKLNPRAQYVQGMNQVLAPIFYLLNNRKKHIQEAACFFMFNNVMSDLLELNIEDFDKRQNGIHARIKEVSNSLLVAQPLIWQKLQSLKIDPIFYCFRWLTLLFAQQFQLFQIFRIWQGIFSCQDRPLFVNCFAVALLSASRDQIMHGDYGSILGHFKKLKQRVNISDVLYLAMQFYQELKGTDIASRAQKNFGKLKRKQKKNEKQKHLKISHTKMLKGFIKKLF